VLKRNAAGLDSSKGASLEQQSNFHLLTFFIMKKQFLFITFALLAVMAAHAQIVVKADGGINRMRYAYSDNYQDGFIQQYGATYESKRQSGYQVGLGVGYKFGPVVTLFLEGQLVREGSQVTTEETYNVTITERNGNTATVLGFPVVTEKINSIHVPLMLQIKPLTGRFSPILSIGPSFNMSFKGRGEGVIETQEKIYPNGDYDLKFGSGRTDDYRSFNMAINLRPGLAVNVDEDGVVKLTLEANFSIGLMDMMTSDRKDFLEAGGIEMLGTQKQRGTLFNLGVQYCPSCE